MAEPLVEIDGQLYVFCNGEYRLCNRATASSSSNSTTTRPLAQADARSKAREAFKPSKKESAKRIGLFSLSETEVPKKPYPAAASVSDSGLQR